jgi:hypothetical protein
MSDSSIKQGPKKLVQITGVITLLSYLLYFVGRRYLEGYYGALGLPANSLHFETTDYLYQSIQLPLLIIIIVFFTLGMKILPIIRDCYIKSIPKGTNDKSIWIKLIDSFKGKEENKAVLPFFITILFFISLTILGVLYSTGLIDKNSAAFAVVTLISTIAGGGAGLLAVFDESFIELIFKSVWRARIFTTLSLIVIILIPYLSSYAGGAYMGFLDISPAQIDRKFSSIELSADNPIVEEFKWQMSSNNIYQTTDTLYLLTMNNELLYIRLTGNETKTVVVPIANLISFTVTPPIDYGFQQNH